MHHQEIREIDDIPMVESTIKSKSVQRDKAKEFIQEERNNAKIDLDAHGRDHRSEFSDSPINEISDIQMVESTMHSMKKPNKITQEAITEDGGSDISSIFPHKYMSMSELSESIEFDDQLDSVLQSQSTSFRRGSRRVHTEHPILIQKTNEIIPPVFQELQSEIVTQGDLMLLKEINELRAKLRKTEETIETRAREVKYLKGRVDALEKEKKIRREQNKDLQSKLEAAQKELNHQISNTESLKQQLSENEINKTNMQNSHQLEIKALQSKLTASQKKIEMQNNEIQELESKIESFEAEKSSLQGGHHDAIRELNSSLSAAESKVSDQESAIQDLKSKLGKTEEEFQSKLTSEQKKIDDQIHEILNLKSSIKAIEAEKASEQLRYQDELHNLQLKLVVAEGNAGSLCEEIMNLKNNIEVLQEEKASQRKINDELKKSLEAAKEGTSIQQELAQLREENAKLQEELSVKLAVIETLRQTRLESTDITASFANTEMEFDMAKENNQDLITDGPITIMNPTDPKTKTIQEINKSGKSADSCQACNIF